jgi:hypothetical protein
LITYHTYHEGTKFIMKESHWYSMKAPVNQNLTPQTEEDIVEIKWVKPGDLKNYYKEAFPSVIDVLETQA